MQVSTFTPITTYYVFGNFHEANDRNKTSRSTDIVITHISPPQTINYNFKYCVLFVGMIPPFCLACWVESSQTVLSMTFVGTMLIPPSNTTTCLRNLESFNLFYHQWHRYLKVYNNILILKQNRLYENGKMIQKFNINCLWKFMKYKICYKYKWKKPNTWEWLSNNGTLMYKCGY